MSDLKLIVGVNRKEKAIINLEKVIDVSLQKSDTNNFNTVFIRGESGYVWSFETDLTTEEQVMSLLVYHYRVIFSIEEINKRLKDSEVESIDDDIIRYLGLERVGDKYVPLKEESFS